MAYKADDFKHTNTFFASRDSHHTVHSTTYKGDTVPSGTHTTSCYHTADKAHCASMGARFSKARVMVVGLDANEVFADPDGTGLQAHAGRGDTHSTRGLQKDRRRKQEQFEIAFKRCWGTYANSWASLQWAMSKSALSSQLWWHGCNTWMGAELMPWTHRRQKKGATQHPTSRRRFLRRTQGGLVKTNGCPHCMRHSGREVCRAQVTKWPKARGKMRGGRQTQSWCMPWKNTKDNKLKKRRSRRKLRGLSGVVQKVSVITVGAGPMQPSTIDMATL